MGGCMFVVVECCELVLYCCCGGCGIWGGGVGRCEEYCLFFLFECVCFIGQYGFENECFDCVGYVVGCECIGSWGDDQQGCVQEFVQVVFCWIMLLQRY